MLESLSCFIAAVTRWSIWDKFTLVQSHPPASGSIFGFSEYLASLALLLVVFTMSDFRYRYRMSMTKADIKTLGIWISFGIGLAILVVDLWYQNGLPVPIILENSNNIKAFLGIVFLAFVFWIIKAILISPTKFKKSNAERFFSANYHFIHEGNTERLHVIAEELRGNLGTVVRMAAKVRRTFGDEKPDVAPEVAFANNFILLLGDQRFCNVVVDKVPAFALMLFEEVKKYPDSDIPIFQFARNIGQEFITNTNSAFYQEDSGYFSGLFGYTQPVTNIVFGSYEFVEKCAADGASPLDTNFRDVSEFGPMPMEGFSRASLAFLKDYLVKTKGRSFLHSYALVRMLHSFEHSLVGLHQVEGLESYYQAPAFRRLSVTVDFIRDAIKLLEEHAERPQSSRLRENGRKNIFDDFADLIFEVIFAASTVSSPPWTAWAVQHNAVWGNLFSFDDSKAMKIIALKVRRLLYAEIRRMDEFANFKGARILGYCLLVLGLKLTDRHKGYRKEFYPLQAASLKWTSENYKRLLEDHPKVAETCLPGTLSYDAEGHRLVKTFSSDTKKEPNREYLALN